MEDLAERDARSRIAGTSGWRAGARSHRSFTSSGSTSAVGDWPGSTSSHSTRHLEPTYSRKTASCH